MRLRKCPSCREIVGAESDMCPRCGVNFRSAQIRRVALWSLLVGAVAWVVAHFVFKVM